MHTFSVKEALHKGWSAFLERPLEFIIIAFFVGGVDFLLNRFLSISMVNPGLYTEILPFWWHQLFVMIWAILMVYVLSIASLALCDGKSLLDISVWKLRRLPVFSGVIFAFYVGLTICLLLLVIPAIFFMAIFGLTCYIVVDQNTGFIDTYRKSAQITKGSRWKVLLLVLLPFCVMFASAVLIGMVGGIIGGALELTFDEIIFFLEPFLAACYFLGCLIMSVASAHAYRALNNG